MSTMRLTSKGDLITVRSKEALIHVQKILSAQKVKPVILGMGANQLLAIKSKNPYLKLELPFDKSYLEEVHEEYELPASVTLSILSSHAVKFGLKGWEGLTGIPATVGGAVFMNAGTNLGEIAPLVRKVWVISRSGEEKEIEITKESFSYRKNHFLNEGDIIYKVLLVHLGQDPEISNTIKEYLSLRNKTQPLKEFTCGCVFKNNIKGARICRAGQFIDILGLKGLTHRNLRISPKHANFIENMGGASKIGMVELIEIIKNELYLQYGVRFETEVQFD